VELRATPAARLHHVERRTLVGAQAIDPRINRSAWIAGRLRREEAPASRASMVFASTNNGARRDRADLAHDFSANESQEFLKEIALRAEQTAGQCTSVTQTSARRSALEHPFYDEKSAGTAALGAR
jgi:hypothetical protein